MTQKKNPAVESPEEHSCRGSFSTDARNKLKLIFTMVRRDISQIHSHGLPLLLLLSAILLTIGIASFIIAKSGNGLAGLTWTVLSTAGGGNSPVFLTMTLLHVVYGYSVAVTMILISTAFSLSYNSEVRKGTVRILTCYPLSVFEITVAKLMYAAIIGFIFAAPVFFLPLVLGLDKSVVDLFAVFATAYVLSLVIVAVGAFVANAITVVTKKMYIQPPVLANLLVVFSFFTSSTILNLLGQLLGLVPVFQAVSQLTPLSLYHQGRLLLSSVLGGPEFPNWVIFLAPIALLVLGIWLSFKLWPDIYERE